MALQSKVLPYFPTHTKDPVPHCDGSLLGRHRPRVDAAHVHTHLQAEAVGAGTIWTQVEGGVVATAESA